MPNAVHKNGALTTTGVVLYRAPEDRSAVLVGLSFVNTGTAATRVLTVRLRTRGDATPRILAIASLAISTSTGNDWTFGEERYLLEPGGTVEAFQGAGADVDWNLAVMEYPT